MYPVNGKCQPLYREKQFASQFFIRLGGAKCFSFAMGICNIKYLLSGLWLVILIFCTLPEPVWAQAALIQGAYRELQQLIKPGETVDTSQPVSELTLEQIQASATEENARIDEQITALKKSLADMPATPATDSRLKPAETQKRLASKQQELQSWLEKKTLSEEVSIKLNRERLQYQEELSQIKAGSSGNILDQQKKLEIKLQTLALKSRLAELFQLMARQHIEVLTVSIAFLESCIKTPPDQVSTGKKEPESDQLTAIPFAQELKQRLSQVRTDLAQLQDLYFEVQSQLDQLDNVEMLYQVLERQKKRLAHDRDEKPPRVIRQELKLKRYLLYDEKTELKTRKDSADKLQQINNVLEALEDLIRQANELQEREDELSKLQQQLKVSLEQRQLWMKSAPSMNLSGWLSMVQKLTTEIPLLYKTGVNWFIHNIWLWLALIPLLWLWRALGKTCSRWLDSLEKPTDLHIHRWGAVFAVIIIRPLLLIFLLKFSLMGEEHVGTEQGFRDHSFNGVLFFTLAWLVLLETLKRRGVFDQCLHQDIRTLPWSALVGYSSLATMWLVGFSLLWYENPFDNRLGQLILLLGSLWQLNLCYFWKTHFSTADWRGVVTRGGITCCLLMVFITSCLGYIQIAWLLFSHLQVLILVAGFLFLGYLMADQWLSLKTSRLVVRRAMNMRQKSQEHTSSVEALNHSRKTVKEYESQGRVILSLLFTFLTLLTLVLLWRDVSPMLMPVAKAEIFSFSSGQTGLSLALGSITSCLVILSVTWLLGNNLPGLLQILLPARYHKQPGYSYNIHRIFVYVIWLTGVILALTQVGVPWEKLQWAILAISVGIGLGLQDMVANFFSGLIILIERPFRVGDTVTVNNIHGTVRRISVRASVIEDFDRKELIVPNKQLISGQLTNWSLTSNVLRVQLWYAIEHGADNDLVYQLLMQAADEAQKVLKSPPPEVYFIEYTEQAERYELRIFVNHVDDRFPAKNQVNNRVKALFREGSIKVAQLKYAINMRSGFSSDLVTAFEQKN